MISVSYSFYVSVYHGSLPEDEFLRHGVKAGAFLDDLTSGKANDALPEDVLVKAQLAFCALCDAYSAESVGDIASETNDGISVTYAARKGTAEQRLRNAAAPFRSGTGLLYRGCCF